MAIEVTSNGDVFANIWDEPATPANAARAASVALYSGGPFANWVPTLQFSSQREKNGPTNLKENPILIGPVWKIALRVGSIPIKVYRLEEKSGEREEARDHPAYKLLRVPNPVLTRSLLISGTVLSLLQTGRCGWYKNRIRRKGKPVEIWPIPGGVLTPVSDPNSLLSHFEIRLSDGRVVKLPPEDVCYFRLLVDPDNWSDGISPLSALGLVSEYAHSALDASTDFFNNALLGRLWVDLKGKELSTAAKNRLMAAMQVARKDRYGVPVMEDGAEIKNMGKEPSGELLHAAFRESAELVHDTLGLPSTQHGATWSPAEEQKLFYAEVVQPIADALEQELERSFMTEWDDDPAFPELQFRETLAGDPITRAQLWQTKILSGQATPNEARKAENLPPVEGGDVIFVPLNVQSVEFAGEQKKKDSGEGLGGQEGKGIVPGGTPPTVGPGDATPGNAGQKRPSDQPKAASATPEHKSRVQTAWRVIRERYVNAHSEAMSRRLKGVLNDEGKALRNFAKPEEPHTLDEMEAAVRGFDLTMVRLLAGSMMNAAKESYKAALDLVGEEPDEDEFLPSFLERIVLSRAQQVQDRFGGRRLSLLRQLFQQRDTLGETLKERWKNWQSFAEGLAETEISWAWEQADLSAWSRVGITQVDFVTEGSKPCSSGVCDNVADGNPYPLGDPVENVGYTFEGSTSPPLHPYCQCFLIPHVAETVQ